MLKNGNFEAILESGFIVKICRNYCNLHLDEHINWWYTYYILINSIYGLGTGEIGGRRLLQIKIQCTYEEGCTV